MRQFLSVVHTNLEPTVFLPHPLSAKMYLRSEIPKLESEVTVAQESPVLSMWALECWSIEQVQAIRIHTSVIFHRELSLVLCCSSECTRQEWVLGSWGDGSVRKCLSC